MTALYSFSYHFSASRFRLVVTARNHLKHYGSQGGFQTDNSRTTRQQQNECKFFPALDEAYKFKHAIFLSEYIYVSYSMLLGRKRNHKRHW